MKILCILFLLIADETSFCFASTNVQDATNAARYLTTTNKLSIGKLLENKKYWKGKKVDVSGYYRSDFELSVLEVDEKGISRELLWIDRFRLKPENEKNIKWIDKGYVRIVGVFDYNDKYGSGHLGMCPARITEVEIFMESKKQ